MRRTDVRADGGSGAVDDARRALLPIGASAASRSRMDDTWRPALGPLRCSDRFDPTADAVLFEGRCEDLLPTLPTGAVQLVVTSPPYNIGKAYERRTDLRRYVAAQEPVIAEAVRVLGPRGSLCWQVGNHIADGEVVPLDVLLYPIFKSLGLTLRNRIVWHFAHGLHASRRLSGRYETVLWFTR